MAYNTEKKVIQFVKDNPLLTVGAITGLVLAARGMKKRPPKFVKTAKGKTLNPAFNEYKKMNQQIGAEAKKAKQALKAQKAAGSAGIKKAGIYSGVGVYGFDSAERIASSNERATENELEKIRHTVGSGIKGGQI